MVSVSSGTLRGKSPWCRTQPPTPPRAGAPPRSQGQWSCFLPCYGLRPASRAEGYPLEFSLRPIVSAMVFMPSMVSAISSSSGTSIRAAPFSITLRSTPAANALSFHFFRTLLTGRSRTLRDGRTSAAAATNPVSSSIAKRAFSRSVTGATSVNNPHPWDATARMYSSGHPWLLRIRSQGWPEEYIRAVASHGWGLFTDVAPVTDLEKTLFAIDELTGLVAAAALVRPSRSVLDLPVKSVLKKWKDKGFAAGVDRKVIEKGAAMMEVPLDQLIADTIEGMKTVAETIGLKGNPSGASTI